METDPEDEETALWRRVMETLLAHGASPKDAIEGANIVVNAYRHKREEAARRGRTPEGEGGEK